MARRYTERDVLDYLDNCVAYYPKCFFMDLEYPYFYSVNSRLSLFADDANWAIAFEESGYANRAFEIELALNFFGRDLRNLKLRGRYNEFAYNSQYFTLVAADALDEVSQDFEKFSPPAAHVKVRVRYVGLPPRNEGYAKWIPTLLTRDYPEPVTVADLARYPTFEYEDLCRTTPDDLRTCLPRPAAPCAHRPAAPPRVQQLLRRPRPQRPQAQLLRDLPAYRRGSGLG